MKERLRQYVIVGNSAAGISAAKEIRRYDPIGQITILSDELTYGYSRVMLPLYIARKISKGQMTIAPRTFYSSLGIRLLRGESAEVVDPGAQKVHTRKGRTVPYDHLLIATGASPTRLAISGADLEGIHYLRKVSDAEAIHKELSLWSDPVLVVGGGLVGVKTVEALLARKRKVHWVISSQRILSQMLDRTASGLFLKAFEKNGVEVHLQTDVMAFEGKGWLKSALLSDGGALPCGLAIIGKGVKPNIDCLAETGITLNPGVLVDQRMATNLPSIFAAGDVAEPFDVIQGRNAGNALWPLAVEGGRIAGSNMTGVQAVFSGALRMNSMEVLGMRVVSAGEREGKEEGKAFRREGTVYRKMVFSEGKLKGFILTGDIRCAGVLTSLIKNQTEVSASLLEEVLGRGVSYRPRLHRLGGCIQVLGT